VASLPGDAVATHLAAFLGVDFAYYWWHRWTHRSGLGWATHVVHHQSEDYNLAVALRQSMTSSLSSWPFYLPLALVGVPPGVFFLHTALNTLGQFWIHTETIRTLGPLELVLNTPSHHRVHHAINPRYLDKNYAGILIVWDRWFGTFEQEREAPVYGTVTPLNSFDPLWANVWYLAKRLQDTVAATTGWNRVRLWVGGPEVLPDGREAVAPEVTPERQVKYDPRAAPGTRAYVLAWFVPVALATTAMLLVSHTAPTPVLALLLVLILWTTWTWGALFERRAAAAPAEALRLVAVGAAATIGTVGTAWAWVGPAAIAACAASAAGLWAITRPAPA
jgi:hypothetical protein